MPNNEVFNDVITVKECKIRVKSFLSFLDTLRFESNKSFDDATYFYSLLRAFLLNGMSSSDRAKLDYAILERDREARQYKDEI